MVLALPLLAAVAAPLPYPADLPAPVLSLLKEARFVGTPAGFRIIALSNVADACAARGSSAATRACVKRAFELSHKTRPRSLDLAAPDPSHGVWLSHLALILGAADRTGPCLDAALHERIVKALAQRSLAEPLAHVPSYPAVRARWPADQSATLAALHRYDRAHDAHLAAEPLRRYATVLASHTAPDGLPMSEVAGVTPTSRMPRGCALSYSVRYLAEVDPARALLIWRSYRERFLVNDLLVTGFREWPPGVDRAADVDSGPIVRGIGAAASAFGIAAARAMGDEDLARSLEGTARRATSVGSMLSSAIEHAASTTLAAAITASSRTQPRLLPPE